MGKGHALCHAGGVDVVGAEADVSSISAGVFVRQPKIIGDGVQPLVACPQRSPLGQHHGRQKVHVDVTDPPAVKAVALDESERLIVVGHNDWGELMQQIQKHRAVAQASTRDLSDDERMHDHKIAFEKFGEARVAATQVVNPD